MKRRYAIFDTTPPQSVSKNITCTFVRIRARVVDFTFSCKFRVERSVPHVFYSMVRNSMILVPYQQFYRSRVRLFLISGLILLLHSSSVAATGGSLTFGGVAVSPGSTVKASVPL